VSTKDFLEKDYYKTLGVPKDAKADEIKKAYRKLARQFHPDANKGETAAEDKFKEVSEAYDVLSDAKRRKEYDEARSLFGAVGDPFDPMVHEALTHAHSDDVTEATCIEVFQPGYRIGDRVVRPARVAVAEPE